MCVCVCLYAYIYIYIYLYAYIYTYICIYMYVYTHTHTHTHTHIVYQLVQCFGVLPIPEIVGRQTHYRLTYACDRCDDPGRCDDPRSAGREVDASAAAAREQGEAEVARADPSTGSRESGGEKKLLTREWLSRQEGWDKGAPCTEQWLRRGNALLGRLAVCSAMTLVEVNRFLNGNEKHDRDKTKKPTKMDHKTSERLVTQLESLRLLKRGSYKVAAVCVCVCACMCVCVCMYVSECVCV